MIPRTAFYYFLVALICTFLIHPAYAVEQKSENLKNDIQEKLAANKLLKAENITLRILDVSQGNVTLEMLTGDRAVRQAIQAGRDVLTAQIVPLAISNPNTASYAAYFTKTNVKILQRALTEIKRINGVKSLKLTAATATPLDQASDLRSRGLSAQALEAYRQLADQGDAEAQYSVAQHYLVGLGTPKDPKIAFEYMQKSAAQGFNQARHNLAAFYQYGQPGISPDQGKALEWYQKAAQDGFGYSQVNLALMYYFGQGVKKDYKKAQQWFTQAAEQGDPRALIYLGSMSENGKGVSRDFNKAKEYYQKAADLDSVEGYSALAWLYASCEDKNFIDEAKALQNAEKAVSLIAKAPEFEDAVWAAYAAAQARAGHYDEAIKASQKSVELIEKNELYTGAMRVKALKDEREHLELYKKHQPCVNHPDTEDVDGQ